MLSLNRRLQELSLRKCPALKQLPASTVELESLRELDVRAPKKQVIWDPWVYLLHVV
jgi:hypothetical protein